MRKSWEWFQARAVGPHARAWLAALSFSESSFFLIPPDVLLIAMLAARAGRWAYLATITTAASLAGAVFGYAIGAFVFEPVARPLISLYNLTDSFAHVGVLYESSTFLVVLTAAFTPIPFKVFVLAGGFFHVPFMTFMIAALIGRAARFYPVAWLSHRYGPAAAELALTHLRHITIGLAALAALVAAVYVAR